MGETIRDNDAKPTLTMFAANKVKKPFFPTFALNPFAIIVDSIPVFCIN